MPLLSRNDRGKLQLKTLDTQVIFDELFMECKTEEEVEWLLDNLQSLIEGSAQDTIDSF